MSSRQCEHVKRGVCATCANPTAAPAAEFRGHITPFGELLTVALNKTGHPALRALRQQLHRKRRKLRREHQRLMAPSLTNR